MSRAYSIALSGLKEGRHKIEFEIDSAFFENFEGSEVREGNLVAFVTIDKRATHADLAIAISGTVGIICDRCLESFQYPLTGENRLVVKFSKGSEEIDPDILYLPPGENELDLKQHLYEFIMLALPIRKVHPDDSSGNSTCDPEMLRKLEEHRSAEEPGRDPRWDELKKLMNKN